MHMHRHSCLVHFGAGVMFVGKLVITFLDSQEGVSLLAT